MEKSQIFKCVAFIVLFACCSSLYAQTFQKDLYAEINDEYVACLNKKLTGYWIYHIAYHIDKETGMVTNLHWNVKKARLVDNEGNKYKVHDTGNDNLGSFLWDLFNNINAYNEGYNITYFDVEDGWLPLPDEEHWPEEGRLVSSVFGFIGNGEKVTWTTYWRIKLNSDGTLKTEVYKEVIDCNPM